MINSDSIPIFGGVTEDMKGNLILANLIKAEDLRWGQMFTHLNQMERTGLSFSLVGRDFPEHVTIKVAEGGMEAKSELVQNAARIAFFCFNRLVLDSTGTIFLASEGIPKLISEWRESASKIMEKHGGKPKPLPILHSTFARFTQAESVTYEERKSLVEFVNYWNSDFQKSVLLVYTKSVFAGTVYDLLKS